MGAIEGGEAQGPCVPEHTAHLFPNIHTLTLIGSHSLTAP